MMTVVALSHFLIPQGLTPTPYPHFLGTQERDFLGLKEKHEL
jgi:hypothetical protein